MPIVIGYLSGSARPVPIGASATAYITFGLFEAAYYAAIIRSGLRAIAPGQNEAARALSLSLVQTYGLVSLPQVIRVISPIMLSQTIILVRDTSLVYVLSLTNLLYLAAAAAYFVISSAASQLVAMLKKQGTR